MCGMKRLVGAVAVIGMLALSGCVPEQVIPTLPPTPTDGPLFASEEEALAAATAAYEAYGAMSSVIAAEGGIEPERIAPYVTETRYADEVRGFERLRESNLRIRGESQATVLQLQRFDQFETDVEIVFYACLDLTASRVIDESGRDVTPAEREDRLVLEVVMVSVDGTLPLRLESDERWPGQSC